MAYAREKPRVTARVHACAVVYTRACSAGGQKKVGSNISIYNTYYSYAAVCLFSSFRIPTNPPLFRPLPRLIVLTAHCLIYNAREVHPITWDHIRYLEPRVMISAYLKIMIC